jgi:hypothetical protein
MGWPFYFSVVTFLSFQIRPRPGRFLFKLFETLGHCASAVKTYLLPSSE